MTFGATDALKIRSAVRHKTSVSTVIVFLGFGFLVCMGSALVSSLSIGWAPVIIVDLLALALAYPAFLVLEDRSIGFRCSKCDQFIDVKTPWQCGYCSYRNNDTFFHSLGGTCEGCRAEPKAYECHHFKRKKHCAQLNFFSEDRQKTNFARSLGFHKDSEESEHGAKIRAKRERKALREAQIDLAETESKLKAVRAKAKPPKEVDFRERLRTKMKNKVDEAFLLEDLLAEEIRRVEENPLLSDKPEERARRIEALREMARENLD